MTGVSHAGAGRYRTIVADPPWDHSDGAGSVRTVGSRRTKRPRSERSRSTLPYAVMSLDQIRALPVKDLAESDAHLYLWVTNRYLRDVWSVAEAWGFAGVCILTWCKDKNGWPSGGTFPSDTEFCLFARRGSLSALCRAPGRWFTWSRRRGSPVGLGQKRTSMHSAKPEAFTDMVEQVSPGPYVELFARRQRLGWDTWGNQAFNTAGFEVTA